MAEVDRVGRSIAFVVPCFRRSINQVIDIFDNIVFRTRGEGGFSIFELCSGFSRERFLLVQSE